jgi:hypothetical protein
MTPYRPAQGLIVIVPKIMPGTLGSLMIDLKSIVIHSMFN